jgi:Mg-chelatase subunit ChlD
MIAAADRARERGVVIFSIGLGPDAAQLALSRVANSPDHYYYAPTPADLAQIYQRIATTIRNFAVTNIVLTNQLGAGVGYVSGSGLPVEPRGSASELTWWQPFVTPQGFALDFRVQVNRAGRVRPSEIAWADYTDGDGTRRRFVFDSPEVEVIVPDTHTIRLPLTFRQQCLPKAGWTDVALAVDNSASMAGSKLAQALAAAKVFLGLLQLPADQAAIVTYDQEARLLQPLTGDRRTLELVLDTITTGSGTRLDHGINLSRQELLGPRHRAGNRRAMVLLSDGRQAEAHPMVYEAADYARAAGITLFTIALGNDADRDLLRAVAGHESRAYFAPDVSALSQIYAQVAGAVSCR